MKFSEIEEEQWAELEPYLDTCLLPVTGLSGAENPIEATSCLEQLRDIMDLVEIPFKGRVLTYPAFHYYNDDEGTRQFIRSLCTSLKNNGFKYIILITANQSISFQCDEADLWVTPLEDGQYPTQEEISWKIREIWKR